MSPTQAKLLSVQVSPVRDIEVKGGSVSTGIFKEPLEGPVSVRPLGLEGDAQADLQHHGGVHRAVYAYPHEHYAYWAREMEREDFVPGQFGENLTIQGLLEDQVRIGDRLGIGNVRLEVSQPRIPCAKLGLRMNEIRIVKPFLESRRVGFYLRVLEEGALEAGSSIEWEPADEANLTIAEITALYSAKVDGEDEGYRELLRRSLLSPALSPGWRSTFEDRLASIS